MSAENEIQAMSALSAALQGLEPDARARVLLWAMSHYGITQTQQRAFRSESTLRDTGTPPSGGGVHETFAELFDATNPKTEKDKALIAAYWVQARESVGSFQSQQLNVLLKDLGHGVGNITEALSQLKSERPALILQLKKSGTTRQARKTYKLTLEGSKKVESMVRGETPAE